jgi:hypothetical protein
VGSEVKVGGDGFDSELEVAISCEAILSVCIAVSM